MGPSPIARTPCAFMCSRQVCIASGLRDTNARHVSSAILMPGMRAGRPRRFVAQDLGARRARVVGERLARAVVGAVRPARPVPRERRLREIHRESGLERDREGGVLGGIDRPGHRRRVQEEQQPVKRHFRDRDVDRFRRVEHTRRVAGATESRPLWVRSTVAERREQKVVQLRALRRNGGFRFVQQNLEDALLLDRVHHLHRRHAMLRLDDPPAGSR